MTFTANVRYDHVTKFIQYLPLDVFSFSVKSSSLALTSKTRISFFLLFSSLYSLFQENIKANLTFAICRKRDS